MIYTVYDIATGVIKQVTSINPAALNRALEDGEAAYEGEVDTSVYDKIVDGAPVASAITFDPQVHARVIRTLMLEACDWTQASDAPLTDAKKQEWRTYRQALRDLPSNVTSCTNEQEVEDLLPTKPQGDNDA